MIQGNDTLLVDVATEDLALEVRQRRREEITADIRSLYLSGTPIFDREAIRHLGQQLRALRGKTGKVFVTGLDGVVTEFAVEEGNVKKFGLGPEYVMGAPYINYRSIQTLTSLDAFSCVPRIAYCSLHIGHTSTASRNILSDEISVFAPVPASPDSLIENFELPESPEASRDIFKSTKQRWGDSQQCQHLTALFQSINVPDIQQIIALACGSIRRDLHPRERPEHARSSSQHALIIALRNILKARRENTTGVSCYAQDPAYTETDKLILADNDINVLDDPDGFVMIDDSTLVLSFAPDVPVRQIVMDIALPAAMIWCRIEEDEDTSELPPGVLWSDPDTPRMWKIIREHYDVFELPGWSDSFGDVALYVRKVGHTSTALQTG